ncbi:MULTISPECIES: hypothetical protein [Halomonadaceae]|nr:hypothetical protein [Halomonas sp. MES3-P3E]
MSAEFSVRIEELAIIGAEVLGSDFSIAAARSFNNLVVYALLLFS